MGTAHVLYRRNGRREPFGKCLSQAWAMAKAIRQREGELAKTQGQRLKACPRDGVTRKRRIKLIEVGTSPLDPIFSEPPRPYTPGRPKPHLAKAPVIP